MFYGCLSVDCVLATNVDFPIPFVTFTLTLISQQDHNYSFADKMWERKLNLAYINPLTSLRWRCSFLLKPDNEFSAIIFSLNIFHLLITLLLKIFLQYLTFCISLCVRYFVETVAKQQLPMH